MTRKLALLAAGGVVLLLVAAVALGDGSVGPSSVDLGDVDLSAGDPVAGETLFEANCAACHGTGATGTDQGPPLVHPYYRPGHHPDAAFLSAVRLGVRQHHWRFGNMPPREGLSDADVADVVAYVRRLQREAGIR